MARVYYSLKSLRPFRKKTEQKLNKIFYRSISNLLTFILKHIQNTLLIVGKELEDGKRFDTENLNILLTELNDGNKN